MPVLDRLIVFISTVLTSSSLIEPLVLARHGSYRTGTSPTLWADAADTQVFFRIIFEILPVASLFVVIPRKTRVVDGGRRAGLSAYLGPSRHSGPRSEERRVGKERSCKAQQG